jgi:hypothetical protein
VNEEDEDGWRGLGLEGPPRPNPTRCNAPLLAADRWFSSCLFVQLAIFFKIIHFFLFILEIILDFDILQE